ncbi:RagB/SusD family nutrient uptake outer membrane protein [Algoriphagus sp. Y33]|uniref:RagB/SusD family nutrient uptake outer membrane protein n=1 Tax=Algoriphagus sp. Y33 TaxID=2772483 RepID=UPI00177F65BA|nr:RagB/SusD family nutrient uptake outer membrane protein [Algoriphagus sp. Y33]
MKNSLIILLIICLWSCSDLDLNPLSEGSSENWYSNDTEITMALNDLYRDDFWILLEQYENPDFFSDDMFSRFNLTPITSGQINGETGFVGLIWRNTYKAIARANTVINSLEEGRAGVVEERLVKYLAEARFLRACMYSRLIQYFGDVPYYEGVLDIDEAFTLSRTPKTEILSNIYADFDFASENLPVSYGASETQRASKGAAYAMKARIAMFYEDWEVSAAAAKACMDLGNYELYPNYGELFLTRTKHTKEEVFAIPRSEDLGVFIPYGHRYVVRNAGGTSEFTPTYDLFFSYLCTDGFPVDESPLFDPRDPFKNRDPRCNMSIVPHGTAHLGFIYQPHPDSLQTLNLNTGKFQINNDNRVNTQFASYVGLVTKKGIDEDLLDRRYDPTFMIVRYADVLLMYAESKIELNQIDESVIEAMNSVRARAYKVGVSETDNYPAIQFSSQAQLRKELRMERRMELAFEGLRYTDLVRWRLAEKVLTKRNYGMLDPDELKEKIVNAGLWFFPGIPEIDEDGAPDLDPFFNDGLVKVLANRSFDKSKNYLWPIPSSEILINENLVQNPNY